MAIDSPSGPRPQPLAILSAGVVCPVGLDLPAFSAAFRAALDPFRETHFVDEVHEPVIGAAVPSAALGLAPPGDGGIWGGEPKLARMFALAAEECLDGAGVQDTARTALVLLGPSSERPDISEAGLLRGFAACEAALGRKLHAASRITRIGRPGLGEAVAIARDLLAGGDVTSVLVAGSDSYLNVSDVNEGLASGRLRSTENKDGFIPGEAAACVLLARPGALSATAPALFLLGSGSADEPDSWSSARANTGKGLAQAIRRALAGAGVAASAVDHRLGDCSGESFFFDEATYAWGRVLREPGPPGHRHLLVASSVGEVGTAAGPLMLALALDLARRDPGQRKISLLHLSSSDGHRAALVTGPSPVA